MEIYLHIAIRHTEYMHFCLQCGNPAYRMDIFSLQYGNPALRIWRPLESILYAFCCPLVQLLKLVRDFGSSCSLFKRLFVVPS